MNYRMVSYTLGWLLLFEAGFLLLPAIVAAVFIERALIAFLWAIAACLAASSLLLLTRPRDTTLRAREGFVIVALSWIVLSLFGCLPFVLTREIPSFIDALFETASGFSTTGASILTDVEALSKSLLFWRSFTHWVGGMGVLVFLMAILPLSGGQNMHIMKAESPGPSVNKLVPRVRSTALWLYGIYAVMTLIEFIFLLMSEMSVFDALCTSFATAGTGGFANYNSGMGGFSPYVQIVVTVFMFLFSFNFGSYFLLLKGRVKEIFNEEMRTFLLIVLVSVGVITWNIRSLFGSFGEALRHAFFTVGAIVSTTGFSTVDFELWPQLSLTIIVLLMFVGACAGSTGGGIKVSRIMILVKGFVREVRQAIHPKQIKKVTVDKKPVGGEVVGSVFAYLVCFVTVFVISLLALSINDYDFTTNFTAVTTALNNIGPGLSRIGPTENFAFFSPFSKLVLIFDMLAGRLELLPMLLLFSPVTWKK